MRRDSIADVVKCVRAGQEHLDCFLTQHASVGITPARRGNELDRQGIVPCRAPHALDLYPQETVDLPEIRRFTIPTLAGKTLAAELSARSRDASGVMRSRLDIEIAITVPSIEELLAELERPADGGEDDVG